MSLIKAHRSRSLSHTALEREGLACHVLKVRRCELYTDAADLQLRISVVSCRRHLDILLERLRIRLLKLLQLRRPCQRADDVDIDAVLCPFGGRHARQSADSFLGGSVSALSEIAEQSRGGYSRCLEGHFYAKYNRFGYGDCADEGELMDRIRELYENTILPAVPKGLCGCIYTQLSDVEDETNGLYTYDRKICKVTKADFRELGRKLDEAMKAQNK